MPSDQALLSTLIGSNYPGLELIFMVPKMFDPLKFDCISIIDFYIQLFSAFMTCEHIRSLNQYEPN